MINRRKPEWLKVKLPQNNLAAISKHQLHTICTSGLCPNRSECWGCGTATFMIGGDICTRSCKFCNVKTGRPAPLDSKEPENIAESVNALHLKHAVITSVDRDDLSDLGASHWVAVIKAVKAKNPDTTMEVLIPDFQGRKELIHLILETHPEVISHNLETVRRLSKSVRSRATYDVSLKVITQIADYGIISKSGIMLGLGEKRDEVI
jgi:lipoic acid synthetase